MLKKTRNIWNNVKLTALVLFGAATMVACEKDPEPVNKKPETVTFDQNTLGNISPETIKALAAEPTTSFVIMEATGDWSNFGEASWHAMASGQNAVLPKIFAIAPNIKGKGNFNLGKNEKIAKADSLVQVARGYTFSRQH